ncbi:carbohydrate kinase [Zoogloea sp.]|uniref:carbohydrate kinase family protein n=1 Tax=Zoogloea sp. TaxID=49181 RepID=UPI0035B24CA5
MFLVCGEALFDVFINGNAAASSDVLKLEAHPGGSPFNVAIGLARLGQPVSFLAGISRDMLGERLVAKLRSEGVETSTVQRLAAPTTLGLVGLDDQGVPAYAFYGDGAADRRLDIAALPVLDPAIRAIHLGSYATVVEPTAGALETLVRRECGQRLIAYDPNVRLNVEPSLARWHARVDTLSTLAHLIKISDEDVRLLYDDLPPEDFARRMLARGARLVVVTRGADGAIAWTARASVQVPGVPVDLQDTVGAGDTFQAAMLTWLADGGRLSPDALETLGADDIAAMLGYAARAAALTCSRRGADLPRKEEVGPVCVAT